MAAQQQEQLSKTLCLHCLNGDVLIVDDDWFANGEDDVRGWKRCFFDDFRNIKSKNWGAIDDVCEGFSSNVKDIHNSGVHPDALFSAEETVELLTSLLTAGLRNERYVSSVVQLAYTCITRSKKYHYQIYNARRFWFMLFDRILLLPDHVFLESITVFLTVVSSAFTEKTKQLCCGPYMIVVDEFLYLDGSFHHNKMYPIFKKLYELQGKARLEDYEFSYDRIVSPLFATAVAQKEWYSLKDTQPVDLIALFTRLSLTRPVMIDLFLLLDPGIPILMDLLSNKSCQRMHSPLLFSIDALMSIDTTDSRFELLRKLLDQLDYSLILKFAVHDEVNYRRALAQKIILHTLRFLDLALKSGFSFQRPCKEELIQVEFSRLKHMITKGGLDDKIFSFIIVTERVESEKESIIKEKFQDYAICVLKAFPTTMSKCNKDTKDQLISCALNLLVAIGPLEEKECPSIFTNNTVEVLSKFYSYDERDIKLLSRVNTVNVCQTSFDKKLELFRLVPIKTWGEEIYDLYRNRRNINKNLYSQLMPVTVKLIHYDLCILYHMKSSGVLEELNGERMQLFRSLKPDTFRNMCVYVNGENWTKMLDYVKADGLNKETSKIPQSVADKMMEVLIATISDKSMPDRYSTIAVACMAHIMHHDELDVSKHITRSLVSTVNEMYQDEANCFYLSDGGDFKDAITKKQYAKLGFGDTKKKSDKQAVKGPRDKKLVEALQSSLKIAETFSACKNEVGITKLKNKNGTKTRAIISIIPNPKAKNSDCQRSHSKENPKSEKQPAPKIVEIDDDDGEKREKEKKTKKIKTCALSSCPRSKSGGEQTMSESAQKRFKKCGRCRAVSYCGKECQAKHWSEHKKHCKAS